MKKSNRNRLIIGVVFVAILAPLYIFGVAALAAVVAALAFFAGLMLLDILLTQKKTGSKPVLSSPPPSDRPKPEPVLPPPSAPTPQPAPVLNNEASTQVLLEEKFLDFQKSIAQGRPIIMEYAIAHALKSIKKKQQEQVGELMTSTKYDALLGGRTETDTVEFLKSALEMIPMLPLAQGDLDVVMIHNFYAAILAYEEGLKQAKDSSLSLGEFLKDTSFLPITVNILEEFKAAKKRVFDSLFEGKTVSELVNGKENELNQWRSSYKEQAEQCKKVFELIAAKKNESQPSKKRV